MTDKRYKWLCSVGWVVASSDRAARALATDFHRQRSDEGLTAWPAPTILTWNSFVREAWNERTLDGRMVMSAAQEQTLWAQIIVSSQSALLDRPLHRLAEMACEAHELLCTYAPHTLDKANRYAWQQDAEAFSNWLTSFDERCRTEELLSGRRLPLELLRVLQNENANRPALLLVGFDRLLPVQRELFDAWGEWKLAESSELAPIIRFYLAEDTAAELAACILWCDKKLKLNPVARLLIVCQDVRQRRGELERAFERHMTVDYSPAFEFSLGIPLSRVPLVQGAMQLLRWLSSALAEHEVDWLLSTGQIAIDRAEAAASQRLMRTLRRQQREQPEWTLQAFCKEAGRSQRTHGEDREDPLDDWVARMTRAVHLLVELQGKQTPLKWAALVSELLHEAGWPGNRSLSSAEHQASQRFQQTVEECASLGFDGKRIGWAEFRSRLAQMLDERLFSTESREAPILIAGSAESAGQTADGIWFLGADEDTWPASGSTHPLLPIFVQREAKMPHAATALDWELAHTITQRLMHSAGEVHLSTAKLRGDVEAKPSRLIAQLAGDPQSLPIEFQTENESQNRAEQVQDFGGIRYPHSTVKGGAQVLTLQSQCAFRAFATTRLGATVWELAASSLTPSQRGNLLHKLMYAIWAGREQGGLQNLADLKALVADGEDKQLTGFVTDHVRRVLRDDLPQEMHDRLPASYIELELDRLIRLVTEWLLYESKREEFEVVAREDKRSVDIAGVSLDLRLDRMDKLVDDSLLIIDYKTGDVSPKVWRLPRAEDLQLPLYAGFALDSSKQTASKERLGGLVFAKIRPGGLKFTGKLRNAAETLFSAQNRNNALVKSLLTENELYDWRDAIEQLAHEFIEGRAVVDPRDPLKTCEDCDLHVLCRISEQRSEANEEDDDTEEEDE